MNNGGCYHQTCWPHPHENRKPPGNGATSCVIEDISTIIHHLATTNDVSFSRWIVFQQNIFLLSFDGRQSQWLMCLVRNLRGSVSWCLVIFKVLWTLWSQGSLVVSSVSHWCEFFMNRIHPSQKWPQTKIFLGAFCFKNNWNLINVCSHKHAHKQTNTHAYFDRSNYIWCISVTS